MTHPETGQIWILHRVVKDGEDSSHFAANKALAIEESRLEGLIRQFRADGYVFVSLDEACRMQENPGKQKYVCITLDDGYKDNFQNAYPLFKRLDVPFTVYVSSGFIDRKANLWWYWIEELYKRDSSVDFDSLHDIFIKMGPQQISDYLCSTYPDYLAWNLQTQNRLALTEHELAQMAADPLCTIGIHTVSHCCLDYMNEAEQRREIEECRKRLEGIIGRPVVHLSYPYGHYNDVTEKVCRGLGLRSTTNSWGGPMRRGESMTSASRTKV